MPYRLAFLWEKADWSELCSTFGFPTWASSLHPCKDCHAERSELVALDDTFLEVGLPWARVTQADYDAACVSCEIDIVVTDGATESALRGGSSF